MKKETTQTELILAHLGQSNKALIQIIKGVFEYASDEEVSVDIIADRKQKSVTVVVYNVKGEDLLKEKFDFPDARIYELKVNAALHSVSSSVVNTLLEQLKPINETEVEIEEEV